MPQMDGFELTRTIRQSRVIRPSDRPRDEPGASRPTRAAGAHAGADGYLVKGKFSQQELIEAVARYL